MNAISREDELYKLMREQLPKFVPGVGKSPSLAGIVQNQDEYIWEVVEGMRAAPMAVRLTPHIVSLIDWSEPRTDPIARQFIPLKGSTLPDHPELTLDSLHEEHDEVVEGLVHRYSDKVLFLCTYCSGLEMLFRRLSAVVYDRSFHC